MDSNGYKQDLDDISRIISQWDCGCITASEAWRAIARVMSPCRRQLEAQTEDGGIR